MWRIIFAGIGGFWLGIITAALLNAAKEADEWVIHESPKNTSIIDG